MNDALYEKLTNDFLFHNKVPRRIRVNPFYYHDLCFIIDHKLDYEFLWEPDIIEDENVEVYELGW